MTPLFKVQFSAIEEEYPTYEEAWARLQELLFTFRSDYEWRNWTRRLKGKQRQWEIYLNNHSYGFAFLSERDKDGKWWALN